MPGFKPGSNTILKLGKVVMECIRPGTKWLFNVH